jgi:hypothetical protein
MAYVNVKYVPVVPFQPWEAWQARERWRAVVRWGLPIYLILSLFWIGLEAHGAIPPWLLTLPIRAKTC